MIERCEILGQQINDAGQAEPNLLDGKGWNEVGFLLVTSATRLNEARKK